MRLFKQELDAYFSVASDEDEVYWEWDHSGNFSVRSMYLKYMEDGVSYVEIDIIWGTKAPLKVRAFI